MKPSLQALRGYRKLVVALVGAAATAASDGLIAGSAARWVTIVVAVLTAAGVYAAPNTTSG